MTEAQVKHAAEVATKQIQYVPPEIAQTVWLTVFEAMIQVEVQKANSEQSTSPAKIQ